MAIRLSTNLRIEQLNEKTANDFIYVVNGAISGWRYVRRIDIELLRHWRTIDSYQPENIKVLYERERPVAILHGEIEEKGRGIVHFLAVLPGSVEAASRLLEHFESRAREHSATGLIGPHHITKKFYGGFILGAEPYHPHWAVDATDAYTRAGWRVNQTALLMIRELSRTIDLETHPVDYEVVEATPDAEYSAEVFGYHAVKEGEIAALCYARWYPNLLDPTGGSIGQIGNVRTEDGHRSKGLARTLVKRCVDKLRRFGASSVLIATGFDNAPALRAYERAGFQRRHCLFEWAKEVR